LNLPLLSPPPKLLPVILTYNLFDFIYKYILYIKYVQCVDSQKIPSIVLLC